MGGFGPKHELELSRPIDFTSNWIGESIQICGVPIRTVNHPTTQPNQPPPQARIVIPVNIRLRNLFHDAVQSNTQGETKSA
ncbi:hypothetical protein M5689_011742 [Euphorbia peplus]|nr:hypothetical protein M5689_011742 [Euphorbia peplus]